MIDGNIQKIFHYFALINVRVHIFFKFKKYKREAIFHALCGFTRTYRMVPCYVQTTQMQEKYQNVD